MGISGLVKVASPILISQSVVFAADPPPPRALDADPTKNVLVNGDFAKVDDQKPAGWSMAKDQTWDGVRIQGNDHYLRLTANTQRRPIITTTIKVEPEWKFLIIAARMRAPDAVVSGNAAPGVVFTLIEKSGETHVAVLKPRLEGGYRDWTAPFQMIEVKPQDKMLQIDVSMPVVGNFDVDNIIVIPFDPKSALDAKQIDAMFAAVEAGDVDNVKDLAWQDPRLIEARGGHYDGGTPLMGAAWEGQTEVAKTLIELGADINAVDRNWKAPTIGWAAFWGRPAIVKLLLDAGANPNSSNGAGATALESAEFGLNKRKSGNATDDERREVIRLLKAAGGTLERQKKTPAATLPAK